MINVKKEKIFIILAAGFLFYFSSCYKKCRKGLTYYGYLPQMESYFGMFRDNNWWVYANQDSTKRDSLYIMDFEEKIKRDVHDDCIEYPERTFKLYGKYFSDNQSYFNGMYNNNANCCENYFYCGIGAKMNSQTNSHPVSVSDKPEMILNNITINSAVYNNVLLLESGSIKAYLAPEKGILKFIIKTDTFNLIKSK